MQNYVHGRRALVKLMLTAGFATIPHISYAQNAIVPAPAGQGAGKSSSPSSQRSGAPTPADEAATEPQSDQSAGLLGDIVVTATKQSNVRAQAVPLAITAFGSDQLTTLQVRTLNDLSAAIPNVQLGSAGVAAGQVNFSIRGLGTNAATASVEPQVGLFIDGVYVAPQLGSLLETFDLEAVEVLRGPQGVLFGKNVTGGAVVVRTTAPKDQFYVDAQASLESGPLYTASAVVSGPIGPTVSVKAAGFFSKDEGYFKDLGAGGKAGGGRTWIARGALRFKPADAIDFIARVETGRFDSDQDTPFQSQDIFHQRGFDVATSGLGYTNLKFTNATAELNVKLGEGKITNIFGWRLDDYETLADLDGKPANLFTNTISLRQRQISNELRYGLELGPVDINAGLYYFFQNYRYEEDREILAATTNVGGGVIRERVFGVFGTTDWHVSHTFTINAGGRFTSDRKQAVSAAIVGPRCNPTTFFSESYVCNFDFSGAKTFRAFIPKFGFQWRPDGQTQLYGSWTIGLRSGGFNLRRTVLGAGGAPYDDERNYAMEAGIKVDLAGGNLRLNAALFRMVVHNLQRDVLRPDPVVVLVSVTSNVGDAIFQGVEAEATARILPGLTLNGYVGITDAHYTRLTADLNGDGLVNSTDMNLKIVRVVPFSFGVGATYSKSVGKYSIVARVNFGYKDAQYFNDNNSTITTPQDLLDSSLSITHGGTSLTLFGRNLLDRRYTNSPNLLPAAFGGQQDRIEKGRVLGISLRYKL